MIEEIIKEKISADHLMHVSMKYTKTCDVILNLLERWRSMIEMSFDAILQRKVDDGNIERMPATPKERIEFIRKYFKKYPAVQETLPLYIFFRRVPNLDKRREGEFRKNVNLKVIEPNRTTEINLDKLDEYSEVLERFISEVKQILS